MISTNISLGRFLSPDPLLEMFPEQTPYQYAFNSPLIWKDPSGLKGEKERGDKMMTYADMLRVSYAVLYTLDFLLNRQLENEKYLDNLLFPFPEHEKDKGGSSGGSGGKSKFQSPTEANLSSSDLPSSGVPKGESSFGNLGRTGGGLSSLGSGAVNQGGIKTSDRAGTNWKSNEIQSYISQTILMMTTTITGQQMLSTIWSHGRIPDIDVVSGFMIRQIYGYDSEDMFYSPLNGLYRGTSKTILIATESFELSQDFDFLLYETDWAGRKARMEPWMIIVHELNHYIQSFTNKFILSIMNQGLGYDYFNINKKRMERECFDKVNAIMEEKKYPYKWIYPKEIRLR